MRTISTDIFSSAKRIKLYYNTLFFNFIVKDDMTEDDYEYLIVQKLNWDYNDSKFLKSNNEIILEIGKITNDFQSTYIGEQELKNKQICILYIKNSSLFFRIYDLNNNTFLSKEREIMTLGSIEKPHLSSFENKINISFLSSNNSDKIFNIVSFEIVANNAVNVSVFRSIIDANISLISFQELDTKGVLIGKMSDESIINMNIDYK